MPDERDDDSGEESTGIAALLVEMKSKQTKQKISSKTTG
jgi:hypothetical protein